MGIFDIFKTDVKDKLDDFWDIIDDPVKDTLTHLQRPQGAVWGTAEAYVDNLRRPKGNLTDTFKSIGEGFVSGWKNPEEHQPDVDTPLPNWVDKGINIGLSAATDPLTYVPVVGPGKFLTKTKLLAPIAGQNASIGRKVSAELATNIGARTGAEIGAEVSEGTPFEGIGSIAGGLIGGGIAAGKMSQKQGVKSSFSEEEFPTKLIGERDYSAFPDRVISGNRSSRWEVFDPKEGTLVKLFNTEQEALDFIVDKPHLDYDQVQSVDYVSPVNMSDGELQRYLNDRPPDVIKYEVVSGVDDTIKMPKLFDSPEDAQTWLAKQIFSDDGWKIQPKAFLDESYYNPLEEQTIEIMGSNELKHRVRDAIAVPYSRAYEDEVLTKSHEKFAVSFAKHRDDNPNVYNYYTNWISSSSGPAGAKVRNAFVNAEPEAGVMYSDGEAWKSWAETQETPLIKGSERMVFLHRGEQGENLYKLPNGTIIKLAPYGTEDITGWVKTVDGDIPIIKKPNQLGGYDYYVNDQPFELKIWQAEETKTTMFLSGQPIVSMSPAIKSGNIKQFLSTKNDEKWAIGRWVPFDDIIGPVGGLSSEYEFLVLEPELIPDAAYKTITGVDKLAPLTQLFKVQKQGNKEIVGYYNTVEEATKVAQQTTDPTIVVPVNRGGAQVGTGLAGQSVPKSVEAELIPASLSARGKGDELAQIIAEPDRIVPPVPQPKTKSVALQAIEQGYPLGGGSILPKHLEGLITNKGYDPKIAQTLEALDPKHRKDIGQLLVDTMGAKGPDEEFIRLVVEGYEKAGKSDPAFYAKANNFLRGAWATGDGSWFGIQGLLNIPHMLVFGARIGDITDLIVQPMLAMVGNKNTMRKYITRYMEDRLPNEPTILEWLNAGAHLQYVKGNKSDFSFTLLDKLPVFKPDEAFMTAGDIARLAELRNTWRRVSKGSNDPELLAQIARAVNRGTGIAEKPFGGNSAISSFVLFAPKFFQSQLEIITKSAIDWSTVEGSLARRQLISLIGTGTAMTVLANYLRGEETELNPLDPNFMRIRNVGGVDISVFGPWDSLAKLVVHLGQGDLGYARTKFAPLISTAVNIITGENFIGEPFQQNPYRLAADVGRTAHSLATGQGLPEGIDPSVNAIKGLLLPFAWQDLGEASNTDLAFSFFGVKTSPLSRSERFENNMRTLGMNPDDPLDRRQFLADHPEMRSKTTDVDKQVNEYRTDIQARRLMNEDRTQTDAQSLVEFRETRKILSRELKNKLDVLFAGRDDFKTDTPQKRWVQSYYDLFAQAQDPITRDIIGSKFDQLESQWLQQNGRQAQDYVYRYLNIGKNPIDTQYLADMRELNQLGYFDMPKYDEFIYELSGLTDEQIEDYRARVSAARAANPELAKREFNKVLVDMYAGQLSWDQIDALKMAGKKTNQNPALAELKELRPDLMMWFNNNSTWSGYQSAKQRVQTGISDGTVSFAIPSIR